MSIKERIQKTIQRCLGHVETLKNYYKKYYKSEYVFNTIAVIISVLALWQTCNQADIAKESAIAAKASADAAYKSIEVSEKAFRVSHRAYVFADSIGQVIKNGKKHIAVYIGNSGQTPAYNVEVDFRISVKDYICPDSLNFPKKSDSKPSRAYIPSHSFYRVTHPMGDSLIQNHSEAIKSGTKFLLLYGKIIYNDIFDSLHTSTFSSYYDSTKTPKFCHNNNK